jgi:dCTP deaminase
MSALSEQTIRSLCNKANPMIHPFVEETRQIRGKPCISFGVTSEGYDVRTNGEFTVADRNFSGVLDVANPEPRAFRSIKKEKDGSLIVPGNTFLMVHTLEYFDLPDNIIMLVMTKSKFARCGLSLNTTKANPGWSGHLLLEIYNAAPFPVRIYPDEGVATMVFIQTDVDSKPYEGQFQKNSNPAVSAVK